ncbi:MAG: hypothetical protein ACQESB_02215, partial [Elusimicrobiota bacterium]
ATAQQRPEFTWSDEGHTYHIQIDNSSSGFNSLEIDDSAVADSSYTPGSNLSSGQYWWRVRAKSSSGIEGDWSDVWTFTIDASVPDSPSLISPENDSYVNNNRPAFNWSEVPDCRYQIQLSPDSSFSSLIIDESNLDVTEYTPVDSLSDGEYYWRVRAQNEIGTNSGWSSIRSLSVNTTVPDSPSLVSPDSGSQLIDLNPTLAWSEVSDTSGITYTLQIDDSSSFSDPLREVSEIKSNIYSVSPALEGGNQYYWRVKAVDGAGNESPFSSYRTLRIEGSEWSVFPIINSAHAAGEVGVYESANDILALKEDYDYYKEGMFSFRSDFNIPSSGWGGWFVTEGDSDGDETRFMSQYSEGYVSFWVKTEKDLQLGIRSQNIEAGEEKSNIMLGRDIGVRLNDEWQQVTVPISEFTEKEPQLDLEQMKVYFNVAVVGAEVGESEGSFWIDDVRWISPGLMAPDEAKVYQGLKNKQHSSGLVRSFESLDYAYTYDQGLAAMAYIYNGDYENARKLLDAYNEGIGWQEGSGFARAYNVENYAVMDDFEATVAGPNLWILQAIMYYRHLTGDTSYDPLMNNLAQWLAGLQDATADGGLGFEPGNTAKSTEHNATAYAVFKNYARTISDQSYTSRSGDIESWLDSVWGYWSGENTRRFKVGSTVSDIDKALDCYSLPILAFPDGKYEECLDGVNSFFRTQHNSQRTGALIDGYDFGGPHGSDPDKDAVWLEGTAQMAIAYYESEDTGNHDYFIQEIEKAIAPMGEDAQGLTYATNEGTAYGSWIMDGRNECISSASWYLFAKNRFNPFYPFPNFEVEIYTVEDNLPADKISWSSVQLPTEWKTADHYLKVTSRPNISNWGMQIYTDNRAEDAQPRFSGSGESQNCAGLIDTVWSDRRLPLAWRVSDEKRDDLTVVQGSDDSLYSEELGGEESEYACFLWMKDRSTPDIPEENTTQFMDGEDYVTVWESSRGIQHAEGTWDIIDNPVYIYMAANFANALTPRNYSTNKLALEFFTE